MFSRLPMLAGLFVLLLSAVAGADTRALDGNMLFTDDAPYYQLHWPLEQAENGWRVVVDKADGTPYFKGQVADPKADDLLDDSNRRGPFVYYYDNGQPRMEGRYSDQGRIDGRATLYWPNGQVREVRDFKPNGYRVLKSFHEDGGVALENVPDKGERSARMKRYREDGSLMLSEYSEPADGGGVRQVQLSYDADGELTRRRVTDDDTHISEQLKDGRVVERLTTDQADTWSVRERFNEDGERVSRERRLLPEYQQDGEQIFTDDDGVRQVDHYRNGKREGEFTRRRGDTWLAQGFYRNDQPVGRWFEVDPDSGDVTVTRYDDEGEHLGAYQIGADLVARDDHGKPTVPEAFQEVARTLPEVGTAWLYQFNDAEPVALTLAEKDGDRARYKVGDGEATLEEDTQRYQPVDEDSGPLLRFPLHPGDVWRYRTEETVKVPASDGAHWQYRYRTEITSRVSAVETVRVGAGTFEALRISRDIAWRKDQASGEGGGLARIKNGGEGQVDGFTRELLWYAPEAGRVVLRAHLESGDPNLLGRPAGQLLDNAATWFTELVGLAGPGDTARAGEPRHAREPRAGWIGFPMRRNNTWEYLMHSHSTP